MAGVITSPAIPWSHRRFGRIFRPSGPNAWQRLVVGPLLAVQRHEASTQRTGASATSPPASRTGPGGAGDTSVRSYTDVIAQESTIQLQWLVEDHSEAVYRVALSVTRDASLAEDAAQDALMKAWQALATFRGDAPLRNWILRITHNTAISLLRRRREDLRDPDELPESASQGSSVERRAEDKMAVEAFEEAIEGLDELSRSIVVLRELEKLSYEEIAAVLDVPLPTVKTRLLRARRVLSTALEGWRP